MAQYITHNSNQWAALIDAINNGGGGGGGGGGGSVTFAALDTAVRDTAGTNFTLSDNISNYDIIIIEMFVSTQTYANQYVGNSVLISSDLTSNAIIWMDGGMNDRYIQLQIVDDLTYKILQMSSGSSIKGIYGIKF